MDWAPTSSHPDPEQNGNLTAFQGNEDEDAWYDADMESLDDSDAGYEDCISPRENHTLEPSRACHRDYKEEIHASGYSTIVTSTGAHFVVAVVRILS